MRHVDSLSRVDDVNIVEANSLEQILAVEQGRDPIILKIRESLEDNKDSILNDKFELHDGLIYKKSGENLLFYVPTLMESNVIRANHDDMGHFSAKKGIQPFIEHILVPQNVEKN